MHRDEILLKIKNLSVGYKTHKGLAKVLDQINLSVGTGEKVGIIGESGSGKTTLLSSILKVLPPNAVITSGEIIMEGINLLSCKAKILENIRREKVGMIFQDPMSSLNPFYKVRDHLYYALKYSGYRNIPKHELEKICIELLKEVKLPDPYRVLDSYPFQLSGGMRQRVVIALALIRANILLLADEPTTNLDVTLQEQILELIKDLVKKRKMAVILVTHAVGSLLDFADRIYVMYSGQVVETAPAEELVYSPAHPYTSLLLESYPKFKGEWKPKELIGGVIDYTDPPPGCRFSLKCPFKMDICLKAKPPSIEVNDRHIVWCWRYKNKHGEGLSR
ncbi:MAG: ABC transporter ATP-binding protein [Thermoprotei archaeon]